MFDCHCFLVVVLFGAAAILFASERCRPMLVTLTKNKQNNGQLSTVWSPGA